ncbi:MULTISPECIES: hypothetical protein [Acetobacter]|uniref:Uncharacterized protein n=1 Tax=Acetobacter cibinongensis TaxID=146475 RepID=A0A1Z5YZ53_9PROT|nr:hypothetical protein [Acetobacter cibinongensis]OUJ04648.1 hypothetical protein HK14_00415 [Acetobacter cibinongensis]GAN59692.1 hypothetical protein Abci_007_095 [Acetobacter cibinongensis]GBQ15192.1 hypothetical protein AA0482_1152 [Acetobacter cibinongensis NRIC 0482]GEL59215.1 hypothetical protein ACI01nite_18170 [Acetobacter cibinongensis]
MDTPTLWVQDDGQPVTCTEKLRVLEENWTELHDVVRDAFEDAVLMGVNEQAMRDTLMALVASLASPKKGQAA